LHIQQRNRVWLVACTALVSLFAQPAVAEWKRAESPRFIVYSDGGSDATLRRYVQSLETYDYLLRARMGLPVDEPPARKLPIYLVSNNAGLVRINPGTDRQVAGTYFPAEEDIFAAAIRDSEQDYLLHEYFHHFFYEMGSTTHYPAWLVEGMAEYFMTAKISPESVMIGGVNDNRAYWLVNGRWIDLDDLLSKRVGEIRNPEERGTYYPVAWLLTHWFMSDETRRGWLTTYLEKVRTGGDSVESMTEATGMTLPEIRAQLRRYMSGRLTGTRYNGNFPTVEIAITRLPRSADDLLLLGQRLKIGVPEEDRAETAALVRRAAARHPDDPFAMLQLGHAELHFGDAEAGEAILTRLLEREPDNVEALQLMASRYMRLASESEGDPAPLMARARGFLARAYRIDDESYYTLLNLAQTRQGQPSYPNDNDMATWREAFVRAPQLASIRLGYSAALMQNKEFEQAQVLLEPLANAPHGGGASAAARTLIELARAGQEPLDQATLDAAAQADVVPPSEPQQGPAEAGPDGGEPDAEPAGAL